MTERRITAASVIVNGEKRPLTEGDNLVVVLRAIGVQPDEAGVAAAVNDEVVPRSRWSKVRLEAGDRVEVLRAVQGG